MIIHLNLLNEKLAKEDISDISLELIKIINLKFITKNSVIIHLNLLKMKS